MASSVITLVNSALGDLRLLENRSFHFHARFMILMHNIRALRTFLLCARKFSTHKYGSLGSLVIHRLRYIRESFLRARNSGNHGGGSLRSLLVRIEHVFCRIRRKFRPYSRSLEDGFPSVVEDMAGDFQEEIESFEENISEWYTNLLDYLEQSSVRSPTTDETVEILDSVLKNLSDFLHFHSVYKSHFHSVYKRDLVETVKQLGERLKLLRNFVRFATLQHVDSPHLKRLSAHLEAIAMNAAHLSYMCQIENDDEEWLKGLQHQISVLLQKIIPINPQVWEIYTQVLTSSKLSRVLHSMAPKDHGDSQIIIMKDFIDSLEFSLWEMLQLDTSLVVSLKDQLQLFYEGLRFLRTIFNAQPNQIDEKIRNLTAMVTCDAGAVIFSLSQNDVRTDLGLVDLLERIKVIRAEVGVNVLETSAFSFPRTNELGFLDFILENLMELTSSQDNSNAQWRVQLQTIQEELIFLRSFLGEIVELRKDQDELQVLWNRVADVAYRVEFLIDSLLVGDISDSFAISFDSILEDTIKIKNDGSKFFDNTRQDIKVKKMATGMSSRVASQRSAPPTDEVVGFEDEAASIIDRLTRGSKQLRIVSIVGMAGQGKTTLAQKVCNDSLVLHHFAVFAWCPISQIFSKKKVLLELLRHVVVNLPDRYFEMTVDDLAEELRRKLKGRRYLIFLDDFWDIEAWNSLEGSFPDDSNGSRVLLTSRRNDVAPRAKLDQDPHFLRSLTRDESWELLQRKLFHGVGCPPSLYGSGMQIAEKCKGLPLTIVIVAGILAMTAQECWSEVVESLSSGIISGTEQCMNTLELGYKHLPDHLKPCLLYFGAFPEDQELSVKRLIHLWIAEGFVRKIEFTSLEDVATGYMMELVNRSLVMVAKQRSLGGVKTCRIHDLLHDFCLTKAKEDDFFQRLQGYDELFAFNEPGNLWRLCIHSQPQQFKDSRLFCPRLRSLLFFSQTKGREQIQFDFSFVIRIFRLLRVLDLRQIHLGSVFPSELELLVHLRYLAIQGEMEGIPSSIGNLSNLEAFILDSGEKYVSLPDSLWNLRKLRYLYIRTSHRNWFVLPTENLEYSSNLYELESFSGALLYCPFLEMQLRKFPNVRKLKCKLHRDKKQDPNEVFVLNFLNRLESLDASLYLTSKAKVRKNIEFVFPANLKKLTLSYFNMPWSKISMVGKLPNLEVLKLLEGSFSGETWEMEEGKHFAKLRFLKLAFLNIVEWTASDDQFPCLEKLVLERCFNLQEFPPCLEDISTLEMIEVSRCSDATLPVVERIREVQRSMGNSSLKILIRHS